ncbi:hypothetical protein HYH03_001071 [Edaphochlamys debaryana]|uniref:Phosphatidate cytidylyltransferase, mitochondrial n=1 Tax=Edaphochlamys debaryana TaxID=47281 RepID=A0A836C6U0_9CHLO|nr:hypothetical protein HYH03_001071 [Edaphochlamys debaryana]|eukprot:KAG2501264.1 hypothetical protein HYH03_001071 [Edaphochlamys debaryana]
MASAELLRRPAVARLASVLQHFPPVTSAFAYGSGVHHQPGLYDSGSEGAQPSSAQADDPSRLASSASASTSSSSSTTSSETALQKSFPSGTTWRPSSSNALAGSASGSRKGPILDFIFAVHDEQKWHETNLKRNPEHYSWVGNLGANALCAITEAVGVGVHFNTLVQLDETTMVKYGVVQADIMEHDLLYWTSLYIAGRMHKPVTHLLPMPQWLVDAELENRHHALATALALLPQTFTEHDLLTTIVGLSYRGDVRMAARAEDPAKVSRIVAGSWEGLTAMYRPLLGSNRYASLGLERAGETATGEELWRREAGPHMACPSLELLPPGLMHEVAASLDYHVPLEHLHHGETTQREIAAAAAKTGRHTALVVEALERINRRSSAYQAAAGLMAAGGGKAVTYVAAKVGKALAPLMASAQAQARQLAAASPVQLSLPAWPGKAAADEEAGRK